MKQLVLVLLGLGLVAPAQASLLVGNDDTTTPVAANAWDVDVSDGSATVLWGDANPDVWGMAYGGGTVFASSGSELYAGTLGSGNPPLRGNITFGGANLTVVGLAWANGNLYASRNISSEGIYEVDPNTLEASLVLDYDDASFDFGGLAYNPLDGLFYGTNDDATPLGSGLYSLDIFGGGAISLITPYPAGETDIDGLAVGDGVAYLVEDEAGDTIHPFDLASGLYLPDIANPMTSSEIFSGAAWVPEPASVALLGLGALALIRRRF